MEQRKPFVFSAEDLDRVSGGVDECNLNGQDHSAVMREPDDDVVNRILNDLSGFFRR